MTAARPSLAGLFLGDAGQRGNLVSAGAVDHTDRWANHTMSQSRTKIIWRRDAAPGTASPILGVLPTNYHRPLRSGHHPSME
ncbi:hypothetical protein BDW67DRAFT_165029 [Aspergillus spinulosporus]